MSDISQDDRTMGLIAHLSGLVTIGPLVVWMVNKDNPEKAFVTNHAKEALNFVITIWLVMIALTIVTTMMAFIPVLGWLVSILIWLVMMAAGLGAVALLVIAGMKANAGEEYRYPFAIRLVK